ncbi:MAG TPA: hypothetical protein P5274_01220 [Candidatus Paceibacterota bacterium]|nr:hypothetical protein [Candidatus Paceibacterota bacterium]
MIKNKLVQLVIVLSIISLIIIILWVSLFFLIKQDKEFVVSLNESTHQGSKIVSGFVPLNKDKIEKINQYFLTDKSIVKFIEELEQIGKEVGVKLVIGQPDDKATELQLNLSTMGTFSQTMKFLQSLENLPYAGKIDRLELRKGELDWQSVFILRVLKDKK